jgi:hypothetical protein
MGGYMRNRRKKNLAGPQLIVKIAPGKNAAWWDECRENGYILVGWYEVGDLSKYASLDDLKAAMRHKVYRRSPQMASMKADELWILKFLRPGDKVIANKGASKVLAVGTVGEPGYEYSHENGHTVAVDWDTSYEQDIPEEKSWYNKTVADVPRRLLKRIFGRELHLNQEILNPSDLNDDRTRSMKSVVEREGQPKHRESLIKAYGGKCAISGCGVIDVLEAAHILRYSGPKSNHPSNGILLRADLHLLFDRRPQLLKVDPKTLCVRLDRKLRDSEYSEFDGRRLRPTAMEWQRPSRALLARLWH